MTELTGLLRLRSAMGEVRVAEPKAFEDDTGAGDGLSRPSGLSGQARLRTVMENTAVGGTSEENTVAGVVTPPKKENILPVKRSSDYSTPDYMGEIERYDMGASTHSSGSFAGGEGTHHSGSFGGETKESTALSRTLDILGGTAANLLSGYAGSPLVTLARLMELPEDAVYALTKNERFNQDNPTTHPGGRDSTALREADPFRQAAEEAKERTGWLGNRLIDTGYGAGNMLSAQGIAGEAMGALGGAGVTSGLSDIAESSPLLTTPLSRAGARVGLDILRNPGNFGVSFESGVNSYSEALNHGASFGQALSNGISKGVTEYLSNKLFAGTPFEDAPGTKGYVIELAEHIAERLGKSEALQAFNEITGGKMFNLLFNKAGEGLEEVVTRFADPLIDRLTYTPKADLATADELTDEFIDGVLLSLLLDGGKRLLGGRYAERERAEQGTLAADADDRTLREYVKSTLDDFRTDLERANGEDAGDAAYERALNEALGLETETAASETETTGQRENDYQNETEEEMIDRLTKASVIVTFAKETSGSRFDLPTIKKTSMSNAGKILMPILQKLGITGKNYTNSSLEITFSYTKNGARRSIAHQYGETKGDYRNFALVHDNLEELCKNAYPLEVHADEKPKTPDNHVVRVATLVSVLRTEAGDIPVKMTVKFYDNEGPKLHVIINGDAPVQEVWTHNAHSTTGNAPVTINIPAFFRLVNGSKEFEKRVPKSVLDYSDEL